MTPDLTATSSLSQQRATPDSDTSRRRSGVELQVRNPKSSTNKNQPIHRWVNWIAGFSADFAGDIIDRYLPATRHRDTELVLDPFAGVGTTLIEAQRRGIPTLGFEINPFAYLACRTKLESANVDADALHQAICEFVQQLLPIENLIDERGVAAAPNPVRAAPRGFRSRIPFFSQTVERKVRLTLDYIDGLADPPTADLFRLAFATTMVSFSNYTYEPSLGSRPGAGKPLQEHASVVPVISGKLAQMEEDVRQYRAELSNLREPAPFKVCFESTFSGLKHLDSNSVSLVLTSPPYMNNYHYVRNTRPHLFWLGYVSSSHELSRFEHESFGKFWQTVREGPAIQLNFPTPRLAARIEALRQVNPDKGIYGGAGWANYAACYYNDSYRLIKGFQRVLKPGGVAVIVVGNNVLQGIEFRVDENLAEIAASFGLASCTEVVRLQRVGSSIMGSGVRAKVDRPVELYEAVTIIEKK
jgi:DNA modification methylase